MKNMNLGTFIFPETATTGTASYTVPGLIPQMDVNKSKKRDDVTHDVFFGENIKRAIRILRKSK